MSPNTPVPPMDLAQLDEIVSWHRQFGLQLAFEHTEGAAVTLDGLQGELVTEILRLARAGLVLGQYVRRGNPFAEIIEADADAEWKRRIR